MESRFSRHRAVLYLAAAVLPVVLIIAAVIGIAVALNPSPQPPAAPPQLHVFNSDLTIQNPNPQTTPTDINDWLHQIAH